MPRRATYCYNASYALAALTLFLGIASWLVENAGGILHATFIFEPEGAAAGEAWRFVSYAFVGNWGTFLPFFLFLFVGRGLELTWGTARFMVFMCLSILAGSGMAFALKTPLAGYSGMATALVVNYALLAKDDVVIYILLPVRARILAWGVGLLFALDAARDLRESETRAAAIAQISALAIGLAYFLLIERIWRRWKRSRMPHAVSHSQIEKLTTDRLTDRVSRIVAGRKKGLPLLEEDRRYIEELIKRADPSKELCSPYSFSPGHGNCPPCSQIGLCLRRYLEADDEQDTNAS